MIRRVSPLILVALLLSMLAASVSMAQDSSAGIPVQFAGRIATIEGTILTVHQLWIDVSGAEVSTPLQVDAQIVIRGVLLDSGVITAQTISIYVPPVPTPPPVSQTSATLPPTLDPANLPIVQPTPYSTTIVGPVQAIGDGILVVNDVMLQYDPDDPFFAELQVGDVLEIEANAYDVGGTTAFDVINIDRIGRASDEGEEEEEEGMGMGMGQGMGD